MAVGVLLLAGWAGSAAAQAQSLGWLAGCWQSTRGEVTIDEQWLAPRGGVLLGASRTTRGDDVLEYEFLRIYQRGSALVLAASPSGQAPAEFTAGEVGAREVAFENPAHDFPQLILYRAVGEDSLHAEVAGRRAGEVQNVVFRYRRFPCAAGEDAR
jgi:hypothetical protein